MEKTVEERAASRICWKARFNATKTFEMIKKVYGKSDVPCATVFRWYNTFLEGRESIHDDHRGGRSTITRTSENIVRVADISKEDRRSLCSLVAGWTGIPKTIVQQILC